MEAGESRFWSNFRAPFCLRSCLKFLVRQFSSASTSSPCLIFPFLTTRGLRIRFSSLTKVPDSSHTVLPTPSHFLLLVDDRFSLFHLLFHHLVRPSYRGSLPQNFHQHRVYSLRGQNTEFGNGSPQFSIF